MRADPRDRIAGVPILAVRGFFNAVGGRLFSEARLAEELGLAHQQAQALLARLLADGYVEYYNQPTLGSTPELDGPWRTTVKGDALAGGGSEPATGIGPRAGVPQFPLVPQGYDRELVDQRMAELLAQLDRERQHASQLGQAAWSTLVKAERERDRITGEAAEAAERLRSQANHDARTTIDSAHAQAAERIKTAEEQAGQLEQAAEAALAHARREQERLGTEAVQAAEQVRSQAHRDARELLSRAQDEAESAWQKVSRERMLLQAEAEGLATLRQATVEQLQRMYTPLGLTLVNSDLALEANDKDGRVESDQLEPPGTAGDAEYVEAKRPPRPGTKGSRNSAAT